MFDSNQIQHMSNATVIDRSGEKVGTVGRIYADNETGRPTFATVKTGLFGTRQSFVPLEGARLDGDQLLVNHTKDAIKDAPNVDENGELSPEEEDQLYRHYGMNGGQGGGHDGRGHEHDMHRDGVRDHDGMGRGEAAAAGGAAGAAGGLAAGHHRDHDRDRDGMDRDGRMGHDRDGQSAPQAGQPTAAPQGSRLRRYTTTEHRPEDNVIVEKEHFVVERERPADGGMGQGS